MEKEIAFNGSGAGFVSVSGHRCLQPGGKCKRVRSGVAE